MLRRRKCVPMHKQAHTYEIVVYAYLIHWTATSKEAFEWPFNVLLQKFCAIAIIHMHILTCVEKCIHDVCCIGIIFTLVKLPPDAY